MLRTCFAIVRHSVQLGAGIGSLASDGQLPSVDDIVNRLIERDSQREAAFHGYVAVRRYVLENSRHHKRAEMLVKVSCMEDGSKCWSRLQR